MMLSARTIALIRRPLLFTCVLTGVAAAGAWAAGGEPAGSHANEIARVLLALILILAAAKLGGEIFVRLGQPSVLGELVCGILIGNLYLVGIDGLDFLKTDSTISILAEIGVVLLLFQVGLESDLAKMVKVGSSALAVATLGIVAPFALGWLTGAYFLPDESVYVHIFIGATLCATSVGITARVLRDLGKLQTPEARIVLGAAVIDDVQGLVILAVVTGIITAAAQGGTLSSASIVAIVAKATLFLVGAIFIGRWLAPKAFSVASRFRGTDMLLTIALGLCFLFAYLAHAIGLAAIVGAFAAGLILDEVHWRSFRDRGEHSVQEAVGPLTTLLVPVFFVTMGARVEITAFTNGSVLLFAGVLTLAAVLGKQICGLGVLQKGLDRLSVGIGMVPRGEVGLIFASIGHGLTLNGHRVVNDSTYSAVVIMVVITTMLTPPALKWSLSRSQKARLRADSESA